MQYNKNKSSTNGSSHRMFSIKKVVLRNFSKFTGKHLCQSLFFNKAAGLVPNAPFLYPLKTSENRVLLFFQTRWARWTRWTRWARLSYFDHA